MNQKTLVIAVVAIIVVVAVVAGVYLATQSGGSTATPTPSATPSIAGASSLGFKVNGTIGGVNELYSFTAKNLGTSDILLRTDEIDVEGNAFIYQFNQTAQTLWIQYGGAWTDQSTDFVSYWDGANSAVIGYTAFEGYKTQLATNWSGSGDYDYTSGGDTFHIYDIIINPSIEDSLFAHS